MRRLATVIEGSDRARSTSAESYHLRGPGSDAPVSPLVGASPRREALKFAPASRSSERKRAATNLAGRRPFLEVLRSNLSPCRSEIVSYDECNYGDYGDFDDVENTGKCAFVPEDAATNEVENGHPDRTHIEVDDPSDYQAPIFGVLELCFFM